MRISAGRNIGIVAALVAGLTNWAVSAADVEQSVLAAESERIAAVKKATPSVLAIFARGGQGGGSGVVISPDGFALTNFHVVKPCGNAMKCGMADGKLYDAVIVGIDPVGDVALIKLFGRDDFPTAEIVDSDTVQVGDWCFAAGNPFLLATDFQPTITYGVVSGTHRYQYPDGTLLEYPDCIQVDASINPGNSGGPLFNALGQLVGINGRGSFEKRGRVNVGVGYAISLNQIKNFLGYLKSGRIVDHATLGASVATDDRGRVLVNNVMESSDAFRRGLRYDDEILSLNNRPVHTVNALKNVLGTYPKGWRVPVVYRRDGQKTEIPIRLLGVHRPEELIEKAVGRAPARPNPKDKDPKDPMPGDPKDKKPADKPKTPAPIPVQADPAAAPLPKICKDHFEARTGYANYFYNKQNQDRVWKALQAKGDFSKATGNWTLTGNAGAGEISLTLTDKEVSLKTLGGEAKMPVTDTLDNLNPPGSNGLLIAAHAWRKFLTLGLEKFGSVYYLGTVPLPGSPSLVDVLIGTTGGVDVWFYFNPADGSLLALEMYSDDRSDPCEVYFHDYKEVEGRQLPHRIEVKASGNTYGSFAFNKIKLETADEKK